MLNFVILDNSYYERHSSAGASYGGESSTQFVSSSPRAVVMGYGQAFVLSMVAAGATALIFIGVVALLLFMHMSRAQQKQKGKNVDHQLTASLD